MEKWRHFGNSVAVSCRGCKLNNKPFSLFSRKQSDYWHISTHIKLPKKQPIYPLMVAVIPRPARQWHAGYQFLRLGARWVRSIDVKEARIIDEKVLIFRHFFLFWEYLRGTQYAAFLYVETNQNKTRICKSQAGTDDYGINEEKAEGIRFTLG